eukprot:3641311-Prymnesium_polylepis.1
MDVDAQAAVQYSRAASEEKLQQKTEERFKDLAEFEAETGLKKGTASVRGAAALVPQVAHCESVGAEALSEAARRAARIAAVPPAA